jgi:eukaryotic-like serine/threonine-protein kinase
VPAQPSTPSPNLPSTGEKSAGLGETARPVPPATSKENDLPPPVDLTGTLSQLNVPCAGGRPPIAAGQGNPPEPPFASSPQSESCEMTVVQRLSDKLLSENISKRMLASGYQMVRPLGEGTYGTVWLAVEENTGVHVAIKFFAHGTGQQWQMLQDEVRQLAVLDDANGIVHLKDVVADADPPYYVMSYAEGGSLAQKLENGSMPLSDSLRIFKEVVQALAYVHAHGVRHCDLKPGNILLDSLGRPLVADFGQAHLSNDATPALGTFFYMAPEQADLGHRIPDTRWDVYGLGALFYAMLTGQPPRKDLTLSGELSGTVELDHRLRRYREGISSTPAPTAHRRLPGMDKALATIIDGCLELDPKKRIASAETILSALEKRRVRKRQVPLLIYGMVAPLLVILLMALAGFAVFDLAIKKAQENLRDQVLDGDKTLAQLLAAGMEMGLQRRITDLQKLLNGNSGDQVRAMIVAETARRRASGTPQVNGDEPMKAWMENAANDIGISKEFSGLSVADADGFLLRNVYWDKSKDDKPLLYLAPNHEKIWAMKWSWRDWFSGSGNQEDQLADQPPVSAPHISQPFLSKDQDRGVLIDVTVPITDADKKVIGVLVGVLTWNDFSRWYEHLKIDNGKIVVFNQRGQALKHQTEDQDDVEAAVLKAGDGNPPSHASELVDRLRPDPRPDECDSFDDPFQINQKDEGGRRLAGYKFFNPNNEEPEANRFLGTQWGVIVEHKKDKVLAPVGNLGAFMLRYGLWMLIAAGALTGAVWVGLIWLLRREERLGHG